MASTVDRVAPRAGAWLETIDRERKDTMQPVAPRAGAWLETVGAAFLGEVARWSRPVRARGLKQPRNQNRSRLLTSRPVRARGLKQILR